MNETCAGQCAQGAILAGANPNLESVYRGKLDRAYPPKQKILSSAEAKAIEQKSTAERQWHNDQRREYVNSMLTTFAAIEAPTDGLFKTLSRAIYGWNQTQGFWESDNTAEKLALMHSELSEALEADRKGLRSDHIPSFTGVEEELADCMIRIFDFAGRHNLRLGEAFIAKLQYNLSRPHKHGKAY